ncbi:MAG: UDP-N-acetylmuramate dehydrogenase [Helicobacteraceae bacterium]|nr:UDP-N-acetylmuramate dehydrogenase [Helicobacteraceae bacterium]
MLVKINFEKYSSIKIGGEAEVVEIRDRSFEPRGFFVIGAACNLLVSPNPPPLAILSREFDYLRYDGELLVVGGACKSGKIVSLCRSRDLGGMEFLRGLPGSLGGLIAMNAGLKGREIFDRLKWADFGFGRVLADEIARGYRFAKLPGVVFEAAFELDRGYDRGLEAEFDAVRSRHPKEPSAGSCFKNPPNGFAGRLIEAAGLKGFAIGGAAFSEIHANFLVNKGGATFDDAISLIELARERVLSEFGITLELEIKVL